MKLAHKVTLDQAVESIQTADAALAQLQTMFTVGDSCEIHAVLARQKVGLIEAAVFEALNKRERRKS